MLHQELIFVVALAVEEDVVCKQTQRDKKARKAQVQVG